MAREPNRQFQQTLWDLQKRFGESVIDTLAKQTRPPSIHTGFPALDTVLVDQGIPRGRLTTLMGGGRMTSGITTLAYRVVAQAQQASPAVYFDLGNTLDADYAASCGVLLDRLLVIRELDISESFGLARDIITAGTPSLIVLDAVVVELSLTAAELTTLLRRLVEPLKRSRCAVLLMLPTPNRFIQVIREQADLILRLERQAWQRRGHDVVGYQIEAAVLKDKERTDERRVLLDVPLYGASGGALL